MIYDSYCLCLLWIWPVFCFFKKNTQFDACCSACKRICNKSGTLHNWKGPQWGTKTCEMTSRLQNELNSSTKTTQHPDTQFKPRATSYLQRRHQLQPQRLIHLCLSSKIKEAPDRQKKYHFLFLNYMAIKITGEIIHNQEEILHFTSKSLHFQNLDNSATMNFLSKVTTANATKCTLM